MRRKQQRALSSRRALFEAALDEFADVGFEGASTRRIADRAEVSVALIRHHFGSKEDLWKATAEEVCGAFAARLARRRDGLAGVGDRTLLRLLLREYLRFFGERPQAARFLVQANHAPRELLEWMVERFVAPADGWHTALLRRTQKIGFFPSGDLFLLRFVFLGAATSLFSFGPTISILSGRDALDDTMLEPFVEMVLNMFVGPLPTGPPRAGLV